MVRFFLLFSLMTNLALAYSEELIIAENFEAIKEKALVENIGIESIGGVFSRILLKGCELPCEETNVFSTAVDGQDQIKISIYRGNSALIADANFIGQYQIEGIPSAPRGVPQIAITFKVSGSNLILEAINKNGRGKLKIKQLN